MLYYLPTKDTSLLSVMDKAVYQEKMTALVNDKKTFEETKRGPTPTLHSMCNHYSLAFQSISSHSVLRLPYNNLLGHTTVTDRRHYGSTGNLFNRYKYTFSTNVGIISSYTVMVWCRQSPLLLWKTLKNAPSELSDKRYRSSYPTLMTHLPPYVKTKLTLFTISSSNRTY